MQVIRELAYFKWEEAGCPLGKDLNFWLEAQVQIVHQYCQAGLDARPKLKYTPKSYELFCIDVNSCIGETSSVTGRYQSAEYILSLVPEYLDYLLYWKGKRLPYN